MTTSGTPRFLITRMSAVGDTILTTPVLCALRDRYPGAFIAWAVEEGAAPLLKNHAGLDRLVVLPRRWFLSLSQLLSVRRRLRELEVEVAIDPQSVTKSALASWLSGAAIRIGFGGAHGRELAPRRPLPAREPSAEGVRATCG